MQTVWATVQAGQIRLVENIDLPEGTTLLVTVLPEGEDRFWSQASEKSLAAIWDNAEDDGYAQLLQG